MAFVLQYYLYKTSYNYLLQCAVGCFWNIDKHLVSGKANGPQLREVQVQMCRPVASGSSRVSRTAQRACSMRVLAACIAAGSWGRRHHLWGQVKTIHEQTTHLILICNVVIAKVHDTVEILESLHCFIFTFGAH